MGSANISALVETRLNTEWTNTLGKDPALIAYDNAPFTPPDAADWIRCTVIEAETLKADVLRRVRNSGAIVIQVFQPVLTGTRDARALADLVASIFDQQAFSGLICAVASVLRVGDTGDGWFQFNVNVPYRLDENR